MVQMWYMEAYPCGDPRLPHHLFPPKNITPDELTKKTGTQTYKCDMLDPVSWNKRVKVMKIERQFNSEDIYTLDGANNAEFQDKIEELFEETENKEDQARLILEGAAYYDVEDYDGKWVRILCEYGDIIVIPAGRNFRFTTTPKNFVKMRRFFKTKP